MAADTPTPAQEDAQEPLTAEERDYYEQRADAQADGWPEGHTPLPRGEDQ